MNAPLHNAPLTANERRNPYRALSTLGILVALLCFGAAAMLHPGGYNWNRDMVSTLLRDPFPACTPAIAGGFLFCLSVAAIFARLAQTAEFSASATIVRVGGIGSMVYASLAFTPLHDLMVNISLVFFLVAIFALMWNLRLNREGMLFFAGCACLAVLLASAAIYYAGYLPTGRYVAELAWGQRASFLLFAIWLTALDCRFPRTPSLNPF